jgi:murein DD-endopeptidase MepM/ murein hydrolase activator NlpD
MPALAVGDQFAGGIPRLALLRTTIPQRPRVEVETYVVQQGDTVFGIAEKFGLQPSTILWGNRETLNDDAHNLFPDQELNILPVDGIYHAWSAGENFQKVAEFYGVDPQTIVEYPGNKLDVYTFDMDNPSLEPGTMLIVPGGEREFVNWGPPIITRANPAVARTYGPGSCGEVYDGAIGGGAFVWPTTERYISGYNYSPATNHRGIDIAGSLGNPVFAIDAGVVVYSGWSNLGYGSLVVLDHGNGWQSLYAHLSSIYVSCGQSIFQAASIGAVGSTGNSSGPHLHFELIFNGAKVNPMDYISP